MLMLFQVYFGLYSRILRLISLLITLLTLLIELKKGGPAETSGEKLPGWEHLFAEISKDLRWKCAWYIRGTASRPEG